ncbi:MAG: heme-copper oxidase subunit III [Dehalococcoidia bacterium]
MSQQTPVIELPPITPPQNGNGHGPWPEPPTDDNRVAMARFGMILFIFVEAMTFAGLLSAFLFIRSSLHPWPPLNLPSYPVAATAVNTLLLLVSGMTMFLFRKRWRSGDASTGRMTLLLLATLGLGSLFLVLQGVEWARLLGFGLTLQSHTYGSIFYLVIGFHAVHVLSAVLWLGLSSARAIAAHFPQNMLTLETVGYFWYFVVLVWPVVYVLVYF